MVKSKKEEIPRFCFTCCGNKKCVILKSQNIEDKNYVLDHNNCLLEERKPRYNTDNHDHYELMYNIK